MTTVSLVGHCAIWLWQSLPQWADKEWVMYYFSGGKWELDKRDKWNAELVRLMLWNSETVTLGEWQMAIKTDDWNEYWIYTFERWRPHRGSTKAGWRGGSMNKWKTLNKKSFMWFCLGSWWVLIRLSSVSEKRTRERDGQITCEFTHPWFSTGPAWEIGSNDWRHPGMSDWSREATESQWADTKKPLTCALSTNNHSFVSLFHLPFLWALTQTVLSVMMNEVRS